MGQVFVAQISYPLELESVLAETVKLPVECAEVQAIIEDHRRAAHAGETVRVFAVVAEVPTESVDGLSSREIDLEERAAIAAVGSVIVRDTDVDEAVSHCGHGENWATE